MSGLGHNRIDIPPLIGPPPPEAILMIDIHERALVLTREFVFSQRPDREKLARVKKLRIEIGQTRAVLRKIDDNLRRLLERDGAFSTDGWDAATETRARLGHLLVLSDSLLAAIDEFAEKCREASPPPPVALPLAPLPVAVDHKCCRCRKRDRHFDDLCKRCANELGVRPTGKIT